MSAADERFHPDREPASCVLTFTKYALDAAASRFVDYIEIVSFAFRTEGLNPAHSLQRIDVSRIIGRDSSKQTSRSTKVMGYSAQIQLAMVLGAILGLLLLGSFISLGSGVATLWSRRGFEFLLGNFSRLLIRLVAYVAGLLAIQQLIGVPLQLNW